ncbi:MAG: penicillin acylase family protein [Candidatus Marinimicrobia bacterium]|mgnify:CR=1 FL=1|jgi:penicillin amidase|nr:penicillin acylase family protein [Candidatus Neomarinimicrobiota bacterium]MBT3840302.1 penicillin acylase family protein [Candidatus Neomarinimicrobiota bacterium]MBT4000300.1 penicillin acylase family protein [Candidatus Neomarinimicrobiota bacterium]MBT4382610.1 penicillin acylase family protein [Candidatus Neomarinimicrobiota bacterium]MBT4578507.1 penicillin acylase family protein [Candidatus Neomarinimicrobiota bacterium]
MKLKQISIVFSVVLVVFLVVWQWIDHPLPQYEGEKKLSGLKNKVDVFTDNFGVPHVFAENEHDLFFTAGYIAASERLFQLSTVALAVRGELASALGDDLLGTDIYLRTWRIHATAKKMVNAMTPDNKKIFDVFCEGINTRIDEIKNDPPVEFKILGIDPPYWDPSIVAGYARMMAHEMQGAWEPEIVYGAVAAYFGKDKLAELIPGYDGSLPTIASNDYKYLKPVFDSIIEEEFTLRDMFGKHDADIGSNNWVVSGDFTESGKPLLANDPHLAYTQPPRWFEIHLNGGRFDVSGTCIAGIPIPVIGQNSKAAWGFTNSMVDDVDFFVEQINPKNKNEYKSGDKWLTIDVFEETIPLKDGSDTTIIIRTTHHGPIISDIHDLLKGKDIAMSMSWTGHWVTTEMDAWVKLNTMESWEDFSKAVKLFGVPGQNIVYADINGNIGWRPAVFVPIRKEGFNMVPRPGHDTAFDWKGKVPYEEMPYLLNPEKGFISTANNKTIDESFPYYISGLWADPSRAEQIETRLNSMDNMTVDDMKSIQLDHTSPYAQITLPYILAVETGKETGNLKRAYQFLRDWDGVEDVNSEAALVYHATMRNLVLNIYGDEMALLGNKYLEAFTGLKYLVHRKLREVLQSGQSSWIDNITTPQKTETLNEILAKSVADAVDELNNNYGVNVSNWKWGDAHSLTHPHKLSSVKFLNWLFKLDVGPFRSGGSDKTPNAGGYSFNEPYHQTAGASMRRIVDFSDMNNTQFILPTGQSGLPDSPHYRDQADMYHNGEYRTTWFNEKFIRSNKSLFRHLELMP